jgi:hypothetical protein
MAGKTNPAPKLLGLLAALALAVGLAACGSSDSTTTPSTTTETTSGQEAGATPTGQGSPQSSGGQAKKASDTGSKSGKGGETASSGSKVVKVHVVPLKVSGGGSRPLRTHGGDNSIQEYGEESSDTELTEAAEALHEYLVAFVSHEWAKACSYFSKDMVKNMEQLGSQGQSSPKGCPAIAASFFGAVERSAKESRELTEVDAASLRREGEQAFLIYHGPEYTTGTAYGPGDLFTMPMKLEDGGWKVSAAIGNQMGIGRGALQH